MTIPRLLLLEDNGSDAERIRAMLTDGGVDHELLWVNTRAAFVTALETQTFDLILAAYGIPGFEDGAALEIARSLHPEIPFIFVSATLGEEVAIESLKRGATDYVLKQRLERLVPSVQQALQESHERQAAPRQYARTEALLQASYDTFRQLVENSPFGIYVVDADFRLVQVSAGAQKTFETVRPLIGRDFAEVLRVLWPEPFASEAIALFRHTLETGEPYHAPNTVERRRDVGEVESYDWKIERITLPDGRFGVMGHFYDLSERQRYETALRESEAQFRNMADSSPVLIWQTDATGVTFVNRHYLEFFAQTLEGVKGMGWANFLHPDDAAAYVGAYRTAFERQEQYEFQCRFLRHDGEYRWLQNFGKPHYGLDHTFLGFVGCSVDVTDIKTAEEISQRTANSDAFRVSLTDALRPLADPVEVQAAASRVLGEYLGANRVAYFEVRGTDYVVEQDYVKVAEPIAGRYPIDSFDPRQLAAFRQGRTATSSDVPADRDLSPEQRSAFANLQIGAYIGVPLIKQGEFVAGLAVHTIEPRVWTSDEVALAEEVAERSWAAVERARVEDALRQSEAQIRSILESITDGFFALNQDWQFTYVNPQAERILNRTPGDLLNQVIWEVYPGTVGTEFERAYRQTASERVAASFVSFYPDHNCWYEVYAYPAADGITVYFRNVTDRKRIEAALHQSEEQTRNILESIQEAFFALDENWQFTYLNPFAETLLDRTSGDLVGKNIWEEYPSLTDNELAQIYRSAMRDRVAASMTAFYPDHDRWYEVRTYPAPTGIAVYFRNVTDQIQAEAALRQSEAQLAAEASALVRLNEASSRLWRKLNLKEGLNEMLGATIELLGADMGNIQLLNSEQGVLRIAVQQGFQQDFLDFFREVSTEDDSACGRTLRSGERTIIEDVETDAPYAPLRPIAHAAGYRGVQSTPLLGRDGVPLGMLSTHWRSPHRPSDQDLRRLDLYVRQASDFIESIHAEAALRQSEAKYRSLFESIDQGFCLLEVLFDADENPFDYRFVEINEAFEEQCGLVDAAGKTILELVPNFEPQWVELYAQVVKSGEAIRFEADVLSLNGIFDIYAAPSGALGQNLVSALFTNITERKHREAIIATDLANTRLLRDLSARLTSEDNIQVLYDEIMATAIALTNANAGTVQILDNATHDLVLLASQGFDRTMTDHFYRVNASSNTPCGIALTRGTRTLIDFDVPEGDDPDGSLRIHVNAGYLSAQSTPLISRSGKPIGMVSTHWRKHHRPSDRELRFLDLLARQAADLIEQRQTEAERQQILQREQAAREEAERANRIKDEFLAVLSHELRSPLNPILGWTRLLKSGKLDAARQAEALKTIERNAKLQTQLIEDLLDISRIMQGKLSLTAAPVSLTFVISAAVETVRLAAEAKQIDVRVAVSGGVDENPPPHHPITSSLQVMGDAARLQQVVWNLLSNAVKFTPAGGRVEVRLESYEFSILSSQLEEPTQNSKLKTQNLNTFAQITVTDTGKGISPDFLPHVFEYFRQEDGSTTRRFGGLGLGLAIVRQIVELHGGTVWAESQGEGQGASFIVRLPLIGSRESGVGNGENNANSPLPTLHSPLTGLQVLLVDDEPDTREFEAFVLEHSGAKVTAVASGVEALQVLEQVVPDVIISDIGMPEMNGYMLMHQIRSRSAEQGGTMPAIALTAYAADVDQQKALQAGFQTHLTKPVEPEQLVKAIVNLLGKDRADSHR